MNTENDFHDQVPTGDSLIKTLEALANPHRLRIVAVLTGGRIHVSQLAREMNMSRPLLYMHLQRLDTAGLVSSRLELSPDGKAMKYYEVSPFALHVTPAVIAEAVKTLGGSEVGSPGKDVGNGKGTEVDDN